MDDDSSDEGYAEIHCHPTNPYPDHQVVLLCLSEALHNKDGFAKVFVGDGEILGCHMLGYEASTMIHEVVVAMRAGSGHVGDITDTIHVHPTLNKVVEYAFEDVPV